MLRVWYPSTHRSVHEFYARGATYDEVHARTREISSLWKHFIPYTSFKFLVEGYNRSISQRQQRDIVESFSFMALEGKIEMKDPDETFCVFEERTRAHLQMERII